MILQGGRWGIKYFFKGGGGARGQVKEGGGSFEKGWDKYPLQSMYKK